MKPLQTLQRPETCSFTLAHSLQIRFFFVFGIPIKSHPYFGPFRLGPQIYRTQCDRGQTPIPSLTPLRGYGAAGGVAYGLLRKGTFAQQMGLIQS